MLPQRRVGQSGSRNGSPRMATVFGENGEALRAVSQVLTLLEMSWHDC